MKPVAEEMLNTALALSEEDRWQLVEALLVSLQPPGQPPFDDSWHMVIKRRAAELQSGQVTPIPWAQVKRQAREKAGG